jgi:hypothetical protein
MPYATLREAGLSLHQVAPPVGHLLSLISRGTVVLTFAAICASCTQPVGSTANIGGPDPSRAFAYSGSSEPSTNPIPNYTTIDFLDPYHYGGTGGL